MDQKPTKQTYFWHKSSHGRVILTCPVILPDPCSLRQPGKSGQLSGRGSWQLTADSCPDILPQSALTLAPPGSQGEVGHCQGEAAHHQDCSPPGDKHWISDWTITESLTEPLTLVHQLRKLNHGLIPDWITEWILNGPLFQPWLIFCAGPSGPKSDQLQQEGGGAPGKGCVIKKRGRLKL